LSQQSHEEWLFLNRNNLEKSLLREVEKRCCVSRKGPTEPARRRRADLGQAPAGFAVGQILRAVQEMLGAMSDQS